MKQDYINVLTHNPALQSLPHLARCSTSHFFLTWLNNGYREPVDYRESLGLSKDYWTKYGNDIMYAIERVREELLKIKAGKDKTYAAWNKWYNSNKASKLKQSTFSDSPILDASDFRPRTFSKTPEMLARRDIKDSNNALKGEGKLRD